MNPQSNTRMTPRFDRERDRGPQTADRRLFLSETIATARKLLPEYADGVPF